MSEYKFEIGEFVDVWLEGYWREALIEHQLIDENGRIGYVVGFMACDKSWENVFLIESKIRKPEDRANLFGWMIDGPWHTRAFIQCMLDGLSLMRFVEITSDTVIVEYEGLWYHLSDNGGEINISLVNDVMYSKTFPSVPTSSNTIRLNSATIVYRVQAVLHGIAMEDIDWNHIVEGAGEGQSYFLPLFEKC